MWISSKSPEMIKTSLTKYFCLFKFAPSMQKMLTLLLAGLATFHETYNRSIPYAAASLATAPKYILFPEQRAKKVRRKKRFSFH
jgi:hypothetical protein